MLLVLSAGLLNTRLIGFWIMDVYSKQEGLNVPNYFLYNVDEWMTGCFLLKLDLKNVADSSELAKLLL